MRLCMFHPADHPLERGWVGRVDGARVVHLAAQTLQSFFTGGASAREHAEYPLEGVVLLAPVLHPPSVRVFESAERFAFANPAAVVGPGAAIAARPGSLVVQPRLAAIVGADETLGGATLLLEWRRPELPEPKDRDFALALGPVLVTWDELPSAAYAWSARSDVEETGGGVEPFDWEAARSLAARGTHLRPGDVLAAPALAALAAATRAEVEVDGIGTLAASVAPV